MQKDGSSSYYNRDESSQYEHLRTSGFFNARVPNVKPSEIVCPTSTAEVSDAIQRAVRSGKNVGVRSGGHSFPCSALVEDGVLIDTQKLNTSIDYDQDSEILSFGPGCRVKQIAETCERVNRFFPFGHSPTVGIGGFLLAGGQGWFMRGWGLTSETWIEKLEVVTANGKVLEASESQNRDLFWALRGSGLGCFGVVTRIWVRTIPAKRLFEMALVFDAAEEFETICKWLFDTNARAQKYGVDTAGVTMYADKQAAAGVSDEVSDKRSLQFIIANVAYAADEEEATSMLHEYSHIPDNLQRLLLAHKSVTATTWDELFIAQDQLNPSSNHERWQCDSILSNPSIPQDQLISTIKPAMCNLPTRRSVGCIYIGDHTSNTRCAASSLPQQYCISTMTCWTDATWDPKMRQWMSEQYSKLASVGVGQYIADFDVGQRVERVMSTETLKKWMGVRAKFDPGELFIGHRGFTAGLLQTRGAHL